MKVFGRSDKIGANTGLLPAARVIMLLGGRHESREANK